MFLHILQRIRTYASSINQWWNRIDPLNLDAQQHQQTTDAMPHPDQAPTRILSTAAELTSKEADTRNAMWRSLRAALRGDKDAQYQMGLSYLNGQLGLDRSYSHAEKWLDQAAHQGHPTAKHTLQSAYDRLAFS